VNELQVIGNRIRIARTMAGFSQAQLAEKVNLSQKTFQRYERAETIIDAVSLKRVAEATGVSVAWIMYEPEEIEKLDGLLLSFNEKQLKFFYQQMELTAMNICQNW